MLISTVRETLRRVTLIAPGDHVLVAFSGGPDSTALLHLLFSMQQELDISLSAAHLNHMLRGGESDAEQLWCADFCRGLDIPFRSKRLDVARAAQEKSGNLEEVGRELRYNFLHESADELGADRIAVAHTADDQAETLLQRLVRGTGGTGLSGMPYMRGKLIRPMLNATRSEVRQYVEMHKLEPRHDSSNEDESYTRVFLRRQVLPQLRKLNPSVESSFATAALLLGDEDDFLNELADGILEEISEETGSGVELRIDSLSELHPALQRRVIRRLVLKVTGSLRRITYRHVEAILAAALDEETAVQFSGFSFAQVLDRLVATEQADEPEIAFKYTVRSGQTIELKEVDKSFTLRIIEASSGVDFVKLSGPGRAFADADAVGDVLRVRNWRPGDRYRSLGAPGSQKLHDIFINAKIDRKCRPGTPVFLAGNRIVWVSGFRIADEFRITEKTERILSIEEV